MIRILKKLFCRRPIEVFFELPLKPSEVYMGLGPSENEMTWRALNDLLRAEIRTKMAAAANAKLTEKPGELAFAMGEVNGLVEFAANLKEIRDKAKVMQLG